jgi:5-methyltetrahydrofolate--homocysteine methyltransferase
MAVLEAIGEAIIRGDAKAVVALSGEALSEGVEANRVIEEGFVPAMSVVGERFKRNEIYIPEMLIAARAMKAGMGAVKPHIVGDGVKSVATFLIGTVKGDLHDIGKNLVGMMLEGAGVKVVDLGTDVPSEKFVEAVREHRPEFLGMSALLTTTMPELKAVLDSLEAAGLRGDVKVLVGGAPVTPKYAAEIGADGFAANAGEAVDRIKELLR